MGKSEEQCCRLCLNVVSNDYCEKIKNVTWDILDVLLLKLDFDDNNEQVMCKDCSVKVIQAFKFKSMCLYTDNTIIPYVDDERGCLVDLREIYAKEKGNIQSFDKLDDLTICRLCMQPILGGFTSVHEVALDTIEKYIPEINFGVVEDPVICTQCFDSVCSHSSFIRNCLAVGRNIKGFRGNNVPYNPPRTSSLNSCRTTTIKPEECGDDKVLTKTVKLESENEDVAIKIECIDIKSEDTDVESNKSSDILCNELENRDILETNEYNCAPRRYVRRQKKRRSENHNELMPKNPFVTQIYKCGFRDYKTKYKRALKPHQLNMHAYPSRVQKYKCGLCDCKTKYKRSLERHQLTIHADPSRVQMYKCDICDYKTKYKHALIPHQFSMHADPSRVQMYKCDLCDYKTKYKSTFKRHELGQHGDPSKVQMYKCGLCDYKTKYKYALKQHQLKKSGKCGSENKQIKSSQLQTYNCYTCKYKSNNRQTFVSHQLVHRDPSTVQMYKCDLCYYKTKYKGCLKFHQLKHVDPSKAHLYKCGLCDYKTKYKGALKAHQLKKHGDPSKVQIYKCDLCDFKTKYKQVVKRHQLIHKK